MWDVGGGNQRGNMKGETPNPQISIKFLLDSNPIKVEG